MSQNMGRKLEKLLVWSWPRSYFNAMIIIVLNDLKQMILLFIIDANSMNNQQYLLY